jgi:hypothetical protein
MVRLVDILFYPSSAPYSVIYHTTPSSNNKQNILTVNLNKLEYHVNVNSVNRAGYAGIRLCICQYTYKNLAYI